MVSYNEQDTKIEGFTLIESVLVIAIIGILAIALGVVYRDYRGARIEVAAKKVKADIEHAKGLAMTKKGVTFGVFFDDSADQYTVYETDASTPVKNPLTKENYIEDFSDFSGVEIVGGDYRVEFNERGEPVTGTGEYVQISDGSTIKTITVILETGKVEVQ